LIEQKGSGSESVQHHLRAYVIHKIIINNDREIKAEKDKQAVLEL